MTHADATSEDIHRCAEKLRASGLRTQPQADRVEAIALLARELVALAKDGDVDELAASSGLSTEMTRWAIRTTFESVTRETLQALLATSELPGHRAVPVDVCAVLLSGNVLTSPARALLLPLLMGVPVIARVSSREQAFARLLAARLSDGCPPMRTLGSGLALVTLDPRSPDGQRAFEALLGSVDAVAAYGSDQTCAEIRRQLAPGKALIEHGHGLGVGVLAAAGHGPAGRDEEELDQLAAGFALDVAAYDQRGCLSPQVIYVEEQGWVSPEASRVERQGWVSPEARDAGLGWVSSQRAQRFAERLYEHLGALQATLPRGPLDPAMGAQQLQFRGVGAALGRLFEGDGWAVTYEGDLPARPCPGYRNIAVHSYRGADDLLKKLRPLGRHLKVVGYAGDDAARDAFSRSLPSPLAPRVCAPGQMQTPAFTSVWDGLPAWHGLLRYVER